MKVLLIDDDETLRLLLSAELARLGHEVGAAATGAEGLAQCRAFEPDAILLDLMLPDLPGVEVLKRLRAGGCTADVIVLTAHGSMDTAITALKLGAYDFLQKPSPLEAITLTLERVREHRQLGEDYARLKDGLTPAALGAEYIGQGQAHEELRRFVSKVAGSDAAVLIRGETGTGKEMVAAWIHRQSDRRDQPFVVVDCAALHENLLQSELFGHERGAFTGAVKARHGLFEAADGGTIFLDEIGDVSPGLQAGLLRVLETSTFRRLGGSKEVRVSVRLIAATNRDLERLMAARQFRKDLYFRLSTIHLDLLPLRRRVEEIPVLVEHFAGRHNARHGTARRFSPEAMELLCAYGWPGNVRELRHVVERSLILADGELIGPADIPPQVKGQAAPSAEQFGHAGMTLVEMEREHIRRVLHDVGGHRARAAEVLGISERNLYRKLHEHHLEDAEAPDAPRSAKGSLPEA